MPGRMLAEGVFRVEACFRPLAFRKGFVLVRFMQGGAVKGFEELTQVYRVGLGPEGKELCNHLGKLITAELHEVRKNVYGLVLK